MKRTAILTILIAAALLLTLVAPVFANDEMTVHGTHEPPIMDGEIDDCYMKLHDFWTTDGFSDEKDPDRTITGSAYACYDDKNFYFLSVAATPVNDAGADYALDMGISVAGYLAMLATEPSGGYTDDQRYEVGIALGNDGTQIWKTCSPADVKDSINEKAVWDEAPFKFFVKRDEAAKNNIYEFAVPWTYLDRTGTMTFKEGSKVTLNYSCNAHTREEYESGEPHYMEYGGGIWNNSYEDGMIVTLGAYQIIIEEEEIAAPEPAAEPAAVPAAEPAVAPAAAEPAAQTSDGIAIAVLAAAASLGLAISIKKRRI